MRAADNESLCPWRALLPHSSSQIGSIVWPARPNDASSHTPEGLPRKSIALPGERGPLAHRRPRNGGRNGESNEQADAHRI
jgi:hypothetical protein